MRTCIVKNTYTHIFNIDREKKINQKNQLGQKITFFLFRFDYCYISRTKTTYYTGRIILLKTRVLQTCNISKNKNNKIVCNYPRVSRLPFSRFRRSVGVYNTVLWCRILSRDASVRLSVRNDGREKSVLTF